MKKNSFWIFLGAALAILVSPAVLYVFLIITRAGGHYKAPSESMAPTINRGDHFYVSQLNYMLSDTSIPTRGDVIVFKSPKTNIKMTKRVIGLPNDRIKLTNGRVIINGETILRKKIDNFLYRDARGTIIGVDQYQEYLPENSNPHLIFEQTDQGPLDNTNEFIVPVGHVFLMGDNRDNSADSRSEHGPGFVPLEKIIGKAKYIMFSSGECKNEANMHCPPFRAIKKL